MAKAKKGDVEAHLINEHFLRPGVAKNATVSQGLESHNYMHELSDTVHPGKRLAHTHPSYGRSMLSPSAPREGYSQGAMANQEIGKDRRSSGHPANTEREAELARRQQGPSDYEVAAKTNPYSKPFVLGQ